MSAVSVRWKLTEFCFVVICISYFVYSRILSSFLFEQTRCTSNGNGNVKNEDKIGDNFDVESLVLVLYIVFINRLFTPHLPRNEVLIELASPPKCTTGWLNQLSISGRCVGFKCKGCVIYTSVAKPYEREIWMRDVRWTWNHRRLKSCSYAIKISPSSYATCFLYV